MLLNRLFERARGLRFKRVLLAQRAARAARARDRAPLVIVPGMFGTRLVDGRGRTLWGSIPRLYRGPSIGAAADARTDGLFADLALLPGLLGIDVYGGMVRFLARAGYVPGEDLHVLDYDWRAGVIAGAEALADLVARLRGAGEERVDLLSVSTGGQIVRWFSGEHPLAVRRAIYIGVPQRGTFDALASMVRGFRFAPLGKLFTPAEAALCQTCFDALPHPEERVFVDEAGKALDLDLYDAGTWARLGLSEAARAPSFQRGLDRARDLSQRSDARPVVQADAFVIGARHLPTPARVIVARGRARVPPPAPRADDPLVGYSYVPGDGELQEVSLAALPGLDPARLWFATPAAHSRLPSDPTVHELLLEALLATDRVIPETKLDKRSLPLIAP